MGGGASQPNGAKTVSTVQQQTVNKTIEDKIQKQAAASKEAVKVLLLGAGECGKSTILKQMKILHMNGFTPDEIIEGRTLVFKNTLDAAQALCQAMKDLLVTWEKPENEEIAARILQQDSSSDIDLKIAKDIATVWLDKGIRAVSKRDNEFHLLDSAPYFLDKVEKYFVADFTPTSEDMLRTRLTTTGIIETEFTLEKMLFKMYDVGGQRGERKKWIHCFNDVTAIMFIASLSEYNQTLAEDPEKNRMEESWDLFENIINLPWFASAKCILFLNKNDLFQEKIKTICIGKYHEDYEGPECNYDAAIKFIKDEYMDRNDDEDRAIYTHVTDATNTQNVQFVWNATQHIILENKLDSMGLSA